MTPAKKGKVTEIYEPGGEKPEPGDKTRLREEIETGEGQALQPGQTIGRYQIVEQLGAGGMANVYKALDTRLERFVALKVIHTAYSRSRQFLERFEREAKSVAALAHPNIVGVIDYGHHEGLPYMVMEYIPGGTLKEHLGEPIPYRQAVCLLAPIARALEAAHQEKIVHRDVKPSNILITRSGQPMLSDFGVAKILEVQAGKGLTEVGMGLGTPEYMSPEQGLGEKVDHRADVYALGVVLYEMVTGRLPYTADTPVAILVKQASQPLPNPRAIVKDLPDSVLILILKALAKDPGQRYQSMGEFAMALEEVCRGQAVVVPVAPVKAKPKKLPKQKPVQQTKEKPSRRHLWLWLIPILLIPFLAVGGWWLITRPPWGNPEPTLTPIPMTSPGFCAAVFDTDDPSGTTYSDDFSVANFDSAFDPAAWHVKTGNFYQENGRMVGVQSQTPHKDSFLVHQPSGGVELNKPVFLEADLQLDSEQHGAYGSSESDFASIKLIGTSSTGGTWTAYCGIAPVSEELAQITCGQYWGGDWSNPGYSYAANTSFDSLHRLRIEFDPMSGFIAFYVDGELIGASNVQGAEKLPSLCYEFVLGMYATTNETLKAYYDNVLIGVLPEGRSIDRIEECPIMITSGTGSGEVFFDDFEDSASDGVAPGGGWSRVDPGVIQQDGVLRITVNNAIANHNVAASVGAYLVAESITFEADMRLDEQHHVGGAEIYMNVRASDSVMLNLTCGLVPWGSWRAKVVCEVWLTINEGRYSVITFNEQIGKSFDQWRHVAIQANKMSQTITFYVDGTVLGSFDPTNPAFEGLPSIPNPCDALWVGTFSSDGSEVIGYFDNVMVTLDTTSGGCQTLPEVVDGMFSLQDFESNTGFGAAGTNVWTGETAFAHFGDGRLSITQSDRAGEDATLTLRQFSNVVIDQPIYFETEIAYDAVDHGGNFGGSTAFIQINAWLGKDAYWWVNCSLEAANSTGGIVVCYDVWRVNAGELTTHKVSLPNETFAYGTTYTFRVEFDPDSHLVAFYINDQFLISFRPDNAEAIFDSCFTFFLGVYSANTEKVTGWFDNVRVGPLTKAIPEPAQAEFRPEVFAAESGILVQDDFENDAYEGSLNSFLWQNDLEPTFQQDGMLVVQNARTHFGQAIIPLQLNHIQMTRPFYFEADLAIASENSGYVDENRNGNAMIWVDGYTSDPQSWWTASCWLAPQDALQENGACAQYWNSSQDWVEVENFPLEGFPDAIGTWHHVRIEVNPIRMQVAFYFDGKLIGTATVERITGLEQHVFDFAVGVYNSSGLTAIGWFDNIEIGYLP